jgi:hypothetical protein
MIYETPLGLLYPVLGLQREQEELQQQQFPLGQLSECSILKNLQDAELARKGIKKIVEQS